MNGEDQAGRKVGLLDRHHLMAFLYDPFCHEWGPTFKLQTPFTKLMKEVINIYVPLDADGTETSRRRVLAEFKVRFLLSYSILLYLRK